MDPEILKRRLERAEAEIRGLEQLIENKTRDLYLSQESLRQSTQFLNNVLGAMANALVILDGRGNIQELNKAAERMLARGRADIEGHPLTDFLECNCGTGLYGPRQTECEAFVRTAGGNTSPCLLSSSPLLGDEGEIEGYVCVWIDISERRQLEMELRHAQKMESLGQMAAGVAHEINTPIQFVGDSLTFLREAFDDMLDIVQQYQATRDQWPQDGPLGLAAARLTTAEDDADLEFIAEEAPGAFERATGGLGRVASIVQALKNFSHPGSEEKVPTDINQILQNTLTLARNEYKYVAQLETDFAEVPEVLVHPGDMGQVFLNLVVNAAHAVEATPAGKTGNGHIRLRTALDGDFLLVEVADDGCGIPDSIRDRIYDPFFTTKEVGKGTGQGLAIARRIVVDKHGGNLEVESTAGQGTCFRVFLPLPSEAKAA
ncbi:MAG: ATP-binding protein [Planctomycetota bacterium]